MYNRCQTTLLNSANELQHHHADYKWYTQQGTSADVEWIQRQFSAEISTKMAYQT